MTLACPGAEPNRVQLGLMLKPNHQIAQVPLSRTDLLYGDMRPA